MNEALMTLFSSADPFGILFATSKVPEPTGVVPRNYEKYDGQFARMRDNSDASVQCNSFVYNLVEKC
jgi:hypothetical protein